MPFLYHEVPVESHLTPKSRGLRLVSGIWKTTRQENSKLLYGWIKEMFLFSTGIMVQAPQTTGCVTSVKNIIPILNFAEKRVHTPGMLWEKTWFPDVLFRTYGKVRRLDCTSFELMALFLLPIKARPNKYSSTVNETFPRWISNSPFLALPEELFVAPLPNQKLLPTWKSKKRPDKNWVAIARKPSFLPLRPCWSLQIFSTLRKKKETPVNWKLSRLPIVFRISFGLLCQIMNLYNWPRRTA